MKNSLTRKLLLAVITLGIAVIATVGSTYAWFSMNTTVEATGMQLTAVTPVNVVISKTVDGTYGPSVEFTTDAAKLYPASTTIDQLTSSGVSFWAVEEGQVIGENGKGGISSSSTKFQTTVKSSASVDGMGRSYFIYEDLWLKTTAGKISLVLESIDLGDVTSAELLGSNATIPSSATDSSATVYAIKNALYLALITDDKTFVYTLDGASGTFKGVTSVASDGTRTIAGDNTQISTLGSAGTMVFDSTDPGTTIALGTDPQHVRVVVWLEGEDPQCENAIGGQGLSIGLKFGYKDGTFVTE